MGDYNGTRRSAPSKRTQNVLPSSEYLQEKLLERRARNTRPKRRSRYTDGPQIGRDDDIFLQEAEESKNAGARLYDSSPLAPASRTISDADTSISSERRRRQMGAKELDAQMDRLTKENFALKLELDHRREHTAKLQERFDEMRAQNERASKIETEHAELMQINSQLIAELEKRDKAVEEAMDIICDLEDKVTFLEENASNSRPTTANADSGYAGTESQEQSNPSSPPELQRESKSKRKKQRSAPSAAAASKQLHEAVNSATPKPAKREPSFMASKKPSTQALRNVYLQTGQELQAIKSFNSLITNREGGVDIDEAVLNSPRLSTLSESSFESMYSPRKGKPERYTWEASEDDEEERLASARARASNPREDSISRVSQWIAERELDEEEETPTRPERSRPVQKAETARGSPQKTQSSTLQRSNGQANFQSLNDALSQARPGEAPKAVVPPTQNKPYQSSVERQMAKQNPKTPTMGGPMFGSPLLPPTPESASTRMLRGSRSTITEDRSGPENAPVVPKNYSRAEPNMRTAPKQMRSSVELVEAFNRSQAYRQTSEYHGKGQNHRRNRSHPLDADGSSSEESSDDEEDAQSETTADFTNEYDGYPDGNSILHGTPSRFLKHPKPPEDLFFSHSNISPPRERKPEPLKRAQSSAETMTPSNRPMVARAETTPNHYAGVNRPNTKGPRSSGEAALSPKSAYSGSSSNGTIVQPQAQDSRNRSLSPEVTRSTSRAQMTSPTRALASPPPGQHPSSFSQKTQKLFRRMSNSHERSRDRETSPLPRLTRTPSSAYVNELPKAHRRPSFGQFNDTPRASAATVTPQQQTQPPPLQRSDGDGYDSPRPVAQTTKLESPTTARPSTSLSSEKPSKETKERRNLFKRSGSTKHTEQQQQHQDRRRSGEKVSGVGRRGSLRDAMGSAASKRPWR